MKRNERRTLRKNMAAVSWLGVALGIAWLAPSESSADDLDVVQASSNAEEFYLRRGYQPLSDRPVEEGRPMIKKLTRGSEPRSR